MESGLLDVNIVHILTRVSITQNQSLVEVETMATHVGHLMMVITKSLITKYPVIGENLIPYKVSDFFKYSYVVFHSYHVTLYYNSTGIAYAVYANK